MIGIKSQEVARANGVKSMIYQFKMKHVKVTVLIFYISLIDLVISDRIPVDDQEMLMM